MTTVVDALRTRVHVPASPAEAPFRIALLGVGQVGGAIAELVRQPALRSRFSIVSGLVRDTSRPRPHAADIPLTAIHRDALGERPDLVIEALGGLEPARTLVLSAIEGGIPVVTANKSLLAAHGDVLLDAAARAGVPLRYEAAVLAGVPFLGTFSRRPLARDISRLCGIVNGTTNFILSTMAQERRSFTSALADAQRRGYAEPDPASDVQGLDAAEKLSVLLRHFGGWSVTADDIDTTGIASIRPADLQAADELDGVLKPVVAADWSDGSLSAFAGPAFVPFTHALARVNGVQNAVQLRHRTSGDLFFAGAGAGPAVTAATVLDDATEIAQEGGRLCGSACTRSTRVHPVAPPTGWFVRLTGDSLPHPTHIADLLSTYAIQLRRTLDRPDGVGRQRWLLTGCCTQPRIADALRALESATGCRAFRVRVLEDSETA